MTPERFRRDRRARDRHAAREGTAGCAIGTDSGSAIPDLRREVESLQNR